MTKWEIIVVGNTTVSTTVVVEAETAGEAEAQVQASITPSAPAQDEFAGWVWQNGNWETNWCEVDQLRIDAITRAPLDWKVTSQEVPDY